MTTEPNRVEVKWLDYLSNQAQAQKNQAQSSSSLALYQLDLTQLKYTSKSNYTRRELNWEIWMVETSDF